MTLESYGTIMKWATKLESDEGNNSKTKLKYHKREIVMNDIIARLNIKSFEDTYQPKMLSGCLTNALL